MNYLTLSTEQVEKINEKHIQSVDKLYRMHAGISSQLVRVSNGIGELEITINPRWEKTNETTVHQFLDTWSQHNPDIKYLDGWEVKVYLSENTAGFTISPNAIHSDELERQLELMNAKPNKKLVFVWKSYVNRNGLPSFVVRDDSSLFRYEFLSDIKMSSCGFFHIEKRANHSVYNRNMSGNIFLIPSESDDYLIFTDSVSDGLLDVHFLKSSRLPVTYEYHSKTIYLVNLANERAAFWFWRYYQKSGKRPKIIIESMNL